jgi:hypothetical protein
LFSRSITTAGALADVMAFSADMRQYVSEKTGREIALWSVNFGAPLGTMIYTARVEGLADLQSIAANLLEDPAYHAKLAAGAELSGGPAVDGMATPIHGELGDPPPVGTVALVTTAVMAAGKYAEAIGWGVEIAQLVESVTGNPVLFMLDEYGTFGQVTWIGGAVDAAAADAANAKISADAAYLAKLNDAAGLFVEGSGHRAMVTRVA